MRTSHPIQGRRPASWRLAAFAALWIAPSLGQPPDLPPPDPVPGWASVVGDPQAERLVRAGAAESLMAAGPDGVRALADLLETEGRSLVLETVARSVSPPPALFGPVRRVLEETRETDPLPAIAAVASFRTREAARVLARFLADPLPGAVRTAAAAGLRRLTGRDSLGTEPAGWQAWARESEQLSDGEWAAALVQGLAQRAERLSAEAQNLRQQLAQAYRKYYVQIPSAQRPALLAELLSHDDEDLRSVGLDLTRREISSGQRLNGEVTEAALRLLRSGSAAWRERGAALVDLLAPPDALGPIRAALEKETDPRAAAAMLVASARWPAPQTWGSVARWIGAGPQTRPAASQTALALLRAGVPPAEPEAAAVLQALRAEPLPSLSPNSLRLLVLLGGDVDRAAVGDLLSSPEAAVRLAAAEALAARADALDRVLAAAQRDPALLPVAAAGVIQHRPTAAGFWAIAALPAAGEQAKSDELLRVAAALPPADLVVAASRQADGAFRERILARLVQAAPTEEDEGALAAGLVLLAETRLALGSADGALQALECLTQDPSLFDPRQVQRIRLEALLLAGRVEAAEGLGAPVEVWMAGLRRCAALPQAPLVAVAIRRLFGDPPDAEDRRFLEEVEIRTATGPMPEHANGQTPDPPP